MRRLPRGRPASSAAALALLMLAQPAVAQTLDMPRNMRIAPALPAPGAPARTSPLLPVGPAEGGQAVAPTRAALPPITLTMEAGVGRLVRLPAPAITVLAADPRIARVQPASSTSLFVMAVGPGRTTIVATAEDGAPVAEYDVIVSPGRAAVRAEEAEVPRAAPPTGPAAATAASMQANIRRLIAGASGVTVSGSPASGFVLSGTIANAVDVTRIEAIARGVAGEDARLVNSLAVLSSVQVNLRVRVAEISRQVTRDLGFNWQALANDGANWMIGLRTGTAGPLAGAIAGAASAISTTGSLPGRVGASFNSSRFDINAVVDALAQDQLITILAEPNLTAQSGETASFLAGGEFPVPVSASAANNTITIEFKQFGVSLAFVPTVLAPDRLNLRVRPEVSELSDNGAISLPLSSGVVRIPALSVRRAETTVELGHGQSFAIAGLLQRNSTGTNAALPGLGEVPVFGALFRSDRFRRNETELVIIITPYLVQPVSNPRALAAPTDAFRPATDLDRILYRRQVARGQPHTPITSRLDAGFILD